MVYGGIFRTRRFFFGKKICRAHDILSRAHDIICIYTLEYPYRLPQKWRGIHLCVILMQERGWSKTQSANSGRELYRRLREEVIIKITYLDSDIFQMKYKFMHSTLMVLINRAMSFLCHFLLIKFSM